MSKLVSITVEIAGRKYSISIERENEDIIKEAIIKLNKRINEYVKIYKKKDLQDIFAMILIENSALLTKQKESQKDDDELLSKLKQINGLLLKTV